MNTLPRLLLSLVAVATVGCERDLVVGGRDDASIDVDAFGMPDVGGRDDASIGVDAFGMPDVGDRDGGTLDTGISEDVGHEDTRIDRDVGVPMGPLYGLIHLLSPLRRDGPRTTLTVQVHEVETTPDSRLVETIGDCEVREYTNRADPSSLDLGDGAIRAREAGGAWRSASRSRLESNRYFIAFGALAAGTTVEVQLAIPGRPVIERTLVSRSIVQTDPDPVPATINWFYDHRVGTDLEIAFTTSTPGGVFLHGIWDPLSIDSSPTRTYIDCDAVDAGSVTLPWALMGEYLVDPEVSAPMVWLLSSETEVVEESDVTVHTVSTGVSQTATLTLVE